LAIAPFGFVDQYLPKRLAALAARLRHRKMDFWLVGR
jgi:hypothetical protein